MYLTRTIFGMKIDENTKHNNIFSSLQRKSSYNVIFTLYTDSFKFLFKSKLAACYFYAITFVQLHNLY